MQELDDSTCVRVFSRRPGKETYFCHLVTVSYLQIRNRAQRGNGNYVDHDDFRDNDNQHLH
jgi:hypothetical protein